MTKCSVCSNEITDKYCSKCGQYLKKEKITSASILKDLFGSLFSLEKSFVKNIKIGLAQPKLLVANYWNGFRGYYYSPGKFLAIAAIFFLLHLMLVNDFLGIVVTSVISQQFTILFSTIILASLSAFIVYFKYKKSFYEHVILSTYHVSLWSIIFVPISLILNLFKASYTIETSFLALYLLLIIIWNARAFDMTTLKRFLLF